MKKMIHIFLVVCIYIIGANYTQAENFVKVGYNQLVTMYVDTDSIQVVRNEPPFYVIRYREMSKDYQENTMNIWEQEAYYDESYDAKISIRARPLGRVSFDLNGRFLDSYRSVGRLYRMNDGLNLDQVNFVFYHAFHRRFKNN